MPTNPTLSLSGHDAPMLHALAKNWWLVLLQGIAAIVFGVLAFIWPGVTLFALVLLYGAFALADGVFALGAAMTGRDSSVPAWWLVLTGLLGIAAAAVAFFWPGLTALVLVMLIGAWAVVRGILAIVGAIQLRKEIEDEWFLILMGLLSVLFGLALLVMPGAGALGLISAIAAYAVAFGILTIGFSLRLRKHRPLEVPQG